MNPEQITNIAIKIGEIGQKVGGVEQRVDLALWIASISAAAAIISAITAGYFSWKLNKTNKEHEKQMGYIAKRSLLIDSAIEVFSRMIFNKILIADKNDPVAQKNFFELQKEALVIESQLVVYAPLELSDAFLEYKDFLITMPHGDIRKQWNDVYANGNKYLLLCRKHLGQDISKKFENFTADLIKEPSAITDLGNVTATANTFGTISISRKIVSER